MVCSINAESRGALSNPSVRVLHLVSGWHLPVCKCAHLWLHTAVSRWRSTSAEGLWHNLELWVTLRR